MKTLVIAGIIVGVLLIAGFTVVNAVSDNSDAESETVPTGSSTCTSCGQGCTASNNCGSSACGAVKGTGSCGCGR